MEQQSEEKLKQNQQEKEQEQQKKQNSDVLAVDHGNDVRDSKSAGDADVSVKVRGGGGQSGGEGGCKVVEVKVAETLKRKRGRPPRNQSLVAAPAPALKRQQPEEEEDVCFICFDGGSLVLCDRKGCPKAYHPACIKRDEAFFRSKAKWNCGWHICSICERASHYLCYTCTYSLCKGCTKNADYVCVRGNKGFCGICMKTIMLIENIKTGNQEKVEVDFDDKTSWEYLFKVYWIFLKEKISLTVDELTQAKNPWKPPAILTPNSESSGQLHDFNHNKRPSLENMSGHSEANHSRKRRKTNKGKPLPGRLEWATNELLELVAHMKSGDTSLMSLHDAQMLLLEYIKINNLRDPLKKSEIICDTRLTKLFGKQRVGHFEMLKLFENHLLTHEKSSAIPCATGGSIDAQEIDINSNHDNQPRKYRKKPDTRGVLANPDDCAAIDVHNMSLIYLTRSSIESLLNETDNFHEKVIGSMVRIKVSGADPKQDMFRLVRVIGTIKASEPYKVGERTTDFMLEILNLHKKEVTSMDVISDQDFSEDECTRLRECIKCGLIRHFTVGEIQTKAISLQALRVNTLLELEISRLNHLRDRANEKGHRKELRDCVRKLQLLNLPNERKRRLAEIPEVHADPTMNPNYESDDGARAGGFMQPGNTLKPRAPVFGGDEKEPTYAPRINDTLNGSASRSQTTTFYVDRDGTTLILKGVSASSKKSETIGLRNDNAAGKSQSIFGIALEELPSSNPAGSAPSVADFETQKLWHYQDPTGKIQGPFPMAQLRRWSTIGHFPLDLRVWMINQKQSESILLTHALSGLCHNVLVNSHVLRQDARETSDDRCKTSDGECSESAVTTNEDKKRVDANLNSKQIDASGQSQSNEETVKSNETASHSSSLIEPVAANANKKEFENLSPNGEELKGNNFQSEQSPKLSDKPSETITLTVDKNQGREVWKSDRDNLNEGLLNTEEQVNVSLGNDKQVDSEGNSGQSSGQNWKPPPVDTCSNNWNHHSSFVALARSLGLSDDYSDLPSPTAEPSNGDLKGQDVEMKQSVSSDAPMQDSGPSWSSASSPVANGSQLRGVGGEWGGYSSAPANPSVEEWESELLPPSSLRQTEVAGDHAATPTSGNCQLANTSPSHPASHAPSWPAIIVTEPDAFTPLPADESVSDLLAEVEAMETRNRLNSSPTSALRCGIDLTLSPDNDCFSPVEGFSPAPDPGKSDALSSSSDIQMHSHSTVTDEQLGVSQVDGLDLQKSSVGHSSTSAEAEEDRKPSVDSVNQCEPVSNQQQPPLPPVTTLSMAIPDTTWRLGLAPTNVSQGMLQGSSNLGGNMSLGGLPQGNLGWGINHWNSHENTNMNSRSSTENPNTWGSQPKYGADRHTSHKVYDLHGRESTFSKSRPGLNRQAIHNNIGNGGSSYRPQPKGQRNCKFYENGYCKKGASCTYRH